MCETYDSVFRRAKEAIRRGDRPSDDCMALIYRWLKQSESKAAAPLDYSTLPHPEAASPIDYLAAEMRAVLDRYAAANQPASQDK